MPDETPPPSYRPPDAILTDRDYPAGSEDIVKHQQRNAIFGPAFGGGRVQSGHAGAGFTKSLIRPAGADTSMGRYYATGHPKAGQDRFAWFVARQQGGKSGPWAPVLPVLDGEPEPAGEVLFGYLLPDPDSRTEAGQRATKAALDERIAAIRDDEELKARLADLEAPTKPARPVVLPEQLPAASAPIVPSAAVAPKVPKA